MAITNLGTANDPASTTGFSQVTAAAACPVGSTVLVIAVDIATALSTTGVTDSKSNIYTLLNSGTQAATVSGAVYTSVITTALTTSDTIKFTARSGSIGTAMSAALITSQGTLDLNVTVATGNSAAPSSGTGTPSVNHELVIGAVVYNSNAVTATQGAGFSSPPNSIADGSTSPGIVAGSILDATATSTTYSPTLTVGRPYVAFLISYFPSPPYPRDFVIRGVGTAAPFLTTPATLALRQNPAQDFVQAPIPGTAAVPFVITYSVPRAPVLSSYLLYFGQAQPITASPVAETNTHFLARAWPVNFNLLTSLRQNVVPPAGILPTQPETQPHFVGRPWLVRFNLSQLARTPAVDIPTAVTQSETNTHFIPRHTAPKFNLLPLLIQNPALDIPLQDSNTHFVADPWKLTYNTTPVLRQNPALDVPPVVIPPAGAAVPFVITYSVPRAPVLSSYLYYYTQPAPPITGPAPIPETNIHFLGKFVQPQHNVLLGLRQNVLDGTSGPLPTQPETQPHYITRPWPISFFVLPELRQNEARDLPILNTNPHFVGRFTQPTFSRLPRLSNDDGTPGLQAETNVHFVAKFTAPSYALPVNRYNTYARDDSTPTLQPETNTHFIPRFTAPTYSLLALLRQNIGPPNGLLPTQPETQPHFIGHFTSPVFARFCYNQLQADIVSVPPQPETNVHFIGKFRQPQHYVLQSLRQGVVPPAGVLPTQPETQPHFLGRFTAPVFAQFRYSFAPQDISIQPETNTHFLARPWGTPHTVMRQLRQNIPAESVLEVPHPHFVPKFSQPNHILLPGLRQTIAADISLQPETNVHFSPKHVAPAHVISRSLYQSPSVDIPPIQPETNTHFLGRFQQPQHSMLASLRRGEAMDKNGPLPLQPETNTHFLGTFRQPNHQILRDYRMSVPTDIIPPTSTVSACVIYGRASYAIIYGDACGCD